MSGNTFLNPVGGSGITATTASLLGSRRGGDVYAEILFAAFGCSRATVTTARDLSSTRIPSLARVARSAEADTDAFTARFAARPRA